MSLWLLIILNCGHLKSSKCSQRLSLSKDRSSKRKSVVTNSLPESFINRENGLLSKERRLEVHIISDKLLQTIMLLLLLLRHFIVWDSVRPHRRQPTKLCHPWDSPGKNTGVGCHFLLHKPSYLPLILLKSHLPFLKIIYSLLRGLHTSSPLSLLR